MTIMMMQVIMKHNDEKYEENYFDNYDEKCFIN